MQVINTVTKLLDLLEDQGLLLAPTEGAQDTQVVPRPTDDRSMVVREILDSERKYVQDLEVLQVRDAVCVATRYCELTRRSSLNEGLSTTSPI